MPQLKTHFFIKEMPQLKTLLHLSLYLRKVKFIYDRHTSFLEVNGRRGNEL